jgi:hypothetical protein
MSVTGAAQNFRKERDGIIGVFRYFPIWTLQETLDAKRILQTDMTDELLKLRFRQFGGVVGHVFSKAPGDILKDQIRAVKDLSNEHAIKIGLGDINAVGVFSQSSPLSVLMGCQL